MQAPLVNWDLGTAYDFFISLIVLHEPAKFGVRAAWAAGMRSRLPAGDRDFLEETQGIFHAPLHWIYTLPEPKDGATIIQVLEQTPSVERLSALALSAGTPADAAAILRHVQATQTWSDEEVEALRAIYQEAWEKQPPSTKTLRITLDWWTRSEEFGERYLNAVRAYYDGFFAEEERRIRPALQKGLIKAQELAEQLELPALLEELSQGVRFTALPEITELTLAPSYWSDPFVFYDLVGEKQMVLLFGARPEDAALVPGEVVPDALLQALKALSDPTRLRILRYLSAETLNPTQLANRLRLRVPTVTHHLNTLRMARLVQVIVATGKETHYSSRLETVTTTFAALENFLKRGETSEVEPLPDSETLRDTAVT